jgi:hypothetical protein
VMPDVAQAEVPEEPAPPEAIAESDAPRAHVSG